MKFIGFLFTAVISYACAAMLSSHVSMDLTATNWTSLWTYFWWAISLPFTFGLFTIITFAAFAVWQQLFR